MSFQSLNTAYTGLYAHSRRMDVIGDNIANSSTPGYRRKIVDLSPIGPTNTLTLHARSDLGGRGVEISGIHRNIDPLLENHARVQISRASDLNVQASALDELESRWNAFAEGGLNERFSELGSAFDNLVNNPEIAANRNIALHSAEQLATQVQILANDGVGIVHQLHDQAFALVNRVNSLAQGIASMGDGPGREGMVDELVSITGATATYDELGGVNISLSGTLLVAKGQANTIEALQVGDGSLPAGLNRLIIKSELGYELDLQGGQLGGIQQAANEIIPGQLDSLDALATQIATSFNAAHAAGQGSDGVGGRNLFDASGGALNFTVSADVAGNPDAIAVAGAGGGTFDTTAAEALAAVVDDADGPAGGWLKVVTNLAMSTNSYQIRADAASEAATTATDRRNAISSVSLDQEMTDLISTQRAYEAAARVISAADEMLDTLINRTGLVGR